MATHSTTDALKIAEYFIWKARQDGKFVTNKKLQKLLYYSQAWSLALRDEAMFRQNIEAWVHGPAIRDVYMEYKDFGFSPIDREIDISKLQISDEKIALLDNVWSVYGKFDGDYLELLSHSEAPWQKAREGLDEDVSSDNIIETSLMRDFYRSKLEGLAK